MKLRAAVLTALAGAALAVPAAPASAAACTQGAGVTVVVDFASLGGGTQTRCTAGDPASGLAALRGAGFTPTRAAQEPGYFLCRIDGKPASDPCQRTSPANAYWSYWYAAPGGSWTYRAQGPADSDPKRGSVEGWAFGAGKPPSSPPPREARTNPSPSSPVVQQTSEPMPAQHGTAGPSALPSQRPSSPSALPRPSPTDATTPQGSPTAAAVADPPVDGDGVTKTFTTHAVFVPWSVLAGVVVLFGLLAATALALVRRRRGDGG